MKHKLTIYQRIMRASSDGKGLHLSPLDVAALSLDDAISVAAENDDIAYLNRKYTAKPPEPKADGKGWTLVTPKCEECDEEMVRYGPALDTGKMGWQCTECGWSMDDCPQWNPDAPKEKS